MTTNENLPEQKTETITLTGRAPARIHPGLWPVLAESIVERSMHNGTPLPSHEYDTRWCVVRQHADGRTLVYAKCDGATAWTGTRSRAGGELLASGSDIPAAIMRVCTDVFGAHCDEGDQCARECIADLPAESLDEPTAADGGPESGRPDICPWC